MNQNSVYLDTSNKIRYIELDEADMNKLLLFVEEQGVEDSIKKMKKIIQTALAWKDVGMTPLILQSEDQSHFRISTKELFGKKLQ